MIPRIARIEPLDNFMLKVKFDDGTLVFYDVSDDVETLPGYAVLKTETALFKNAQLDESRTCISWNSEVDLPSDIIYEFGRRV